MAVSAGGAAVLPPVAGGVRPAPGAAAELRAAAGAMPVPRVLRLFLAHFAREIAANNGLAQAAGGEQAVLAGLRPLVERLVFARVHAHVFRGVEVIPASVVSGGQKAKTAAAAAGSGSMAAAAAAALLSVAAAGPQVPPGSAADVMARRDRVWLRKQPLAARLSADEIGVPAVFLGRLPCEAPAPAAAPQPFAVASALLARIDGLVHPSEMVTHLVAAIDAAVAEGMARAAATLAREAAAARKPQRAAPDVTAEDLMPLLIFVCSRSRWLQPHAALGYMSAYGTGPGAAFSSGGKESYLITVASSGVAYICQRKAPERGGAAVAAATSATARRRAATGEDVTALVPPAAISAASSGPTDDEAARARADEAEYARFAAGLAAPGAAAAAAELAEEADAEAAAEVEAEDEDEEDEDDYDALLEDDFFGAPERGAAAPAADGAGGGRDVASLRSLIRESDTLEGALAHFV